jgi:hypothetical protein
MPVNRSLRLVISRANWMLFLIGSTDRPITTLAVMDLPRLDRRAAQSCPLNINCLAPIVPIIKLPNNIETPA